MKSYSITIFVEEPDEFDVNDEEVLREQVKASLQNAINKDDEGVDDMEFVIEDLEDSFS